jgi:predicted small secreted protein
MLIIRNYRLLRCCVMATLGAAGLALSSCHTVQGLGEDLSHLGDKITSKAQEHSGGSSSKEQ